MAAATACDDRAGGGGKDFGCGHVGNSVWHRSGRSVSRLYRPQRTEPTGRFRHPSSRLHIPSRHPVQRSRPRSGPDSRSGARPRGLRTGRASVVEEASAPPNSEQFLAQAGHSPPFAQMPYEKFSRVQAVAIAEQEWRLFGQRVDDNPPDLSRESEPNDDLQRLPGFWQRIGEYWWLGQDATRREFAWTGMHDETGQEIDIVRADYYAWSAAFISYVMRTAGAGAALSLCTLALRLHQLAKEMKLGRTSGWVVVAERVDAVRTRSRRPHLLLARQAPDDLREAAGAPLSGALRHRRSRDKDQISVIGGNVDAAVTMKHVPVTADGRLSEAGDRVLDGRYPWFVVLRILYRIVRRHPLESPAMRRRASSSVAGEAAQA